MIHYTVEVQLPVHRLQGCQMIKQKVLILVFFRYHLLGITSMHKWYIPLCMPCKARGVICYSVPTSTLFMNIKDALIFSHWHKWMCIVLCAGLKASTPHCFLLVAFRIWATSSVCWGSWSPQTAAAASTPWVSWSSPVPAVAPSPSRLVFSCPGRHPGSQSPGSPQVPDTRLSQLGERREKRRGREEGETGPKYRQSRWDRMKLSTSFTEHKTEKKQT